VVIGENIISYWRLQENLETFQANLAKGAVIDTDSDPLLQAKAADAVRDFCKKTGINLAGFDFLFSGHTKAETEADTPLFLEINYFFGRTGLGGSEKFYELLNREIKKWRDNL
jgi:ribosomal protein S6--L-glutamate ligase